MSPPVASFVFVGCFLVLFVPGQTLVDGVRSEIQSCETACEGTYPGEEEQQVRLRGFCRNGCRLLNAIDVLHGFDDPNDMKLACYKCCCDSFGLGQSIEACRFGCDSQAARAWERRKQLEEYRFAQHLDSLLSTLNIGGIFSGNTLNSDDEASRSSYAQTLNGAVVIIAQSSSVLSAAGDDSIEVSSYDYMEVIGPVVPVPSVDADGQPSSLTAGQERGSHLALKSDVILHTCIILRMGMSRILAAFLFILFVLLIVWVLTSLPDTLTKQDRRLPLEKPNPSYYQFCDEEGELKTFVIPSPNNVKAGGPHPSAADASHSKQMELIDIGSSFPVDCKVEAV